MTGAGKKGNGAKDEDGTLATEWFIVADLGLTAFSGNDGMHVFVNALTSTDPVAKTEVRLVARNNEILATRSTDAAGHVLFEAGLARGRRSRGRDGTARDHVNGGAGRKAHEDGDRLRGPSLRERAGREQEKAGKQGSQWTLKGHCLFLIL